MKPTTREEFLSANRDKGEKKSRVRMNLATKLGTPMGGDEKEERRIKKKRKTEGHISVSEEEGWGFMFGTRAGLHK